MMENFIAYALMPSFHFLMRIAGLFSKKIQLGLEDRQNKPWMKVPKAQRPVLIHCSSGEFEYAKPLIRNLKKLNPGTPIYVSYFSPSYKKNILATPEVDFAFPSLWENPAVINEFLNHAQPKAYLISRTDAWPVMLSCCRKKGIPSVLFSATLTTKAKRLSNPFSRWLSCWILGHLDQILCVTEDDKNTFFKLGLQAIVTGDTRYDQVLWRISHPKELKNSLRPNSTQNVIVCGSTWYEDEAILIPSAKELKGKWRWIIAPHEPTPEHLKNLELSLASSSLSFQRYTQTQNWTADVLIVDQVGILADLYSWGQAAFVGGSFKKTVHSVMEPLAQGCWTFVGPLHTNNREAQLFQTMNIGSNKQTAVTAFSKSTELIVLLKQLTDAKPEIQSLVQNQSGASERIAQKLKPLV